MNNNFGKRFNIEIYGGSHTESLGVVIGGVPQGIALCESDFEADLSRRRAGAKGTTPRREGDVPHIVAGVAMVLLRARRWRLFFITKIDARATMSALKTIPDLRTQTLRRDISMANSLICEEVVYFRVE
jgi:hypothetical protein